jgi:hypothetical protein
MRRFGEAACVLAVFPFDALNKHEDGSDFVDGAEYSLAESPAGVRFDVLIRRLT